MAELIDECLQLCRILGGSVGTAKGQRIAAADSEPMGLREAASDSFPDFQFSFLNSQRPFTRLDHLAIVVSDTEEALKIWRDRVGLAVLYSEIVNEGAVRLTHLDLGNTHLQLVEPLLPRHPLKVWLKKNGPGLHHFCLGVEDVGAAHAGLPKLGLGVAPAPHQGTQGKRALFLDKSSTQGVQLEVTGR